MLPVSRVRRDRRWLAASGTKMGEDEGRTLSVGEVYGEPCVDGLEEDVLVSGTGCVEHTVCKVEGVRWERGRGRGWGRGLFRFHIVVV